MNDANEMLDVISQVLIRCVVMGLVVLLFWWGVLVFMPEVAFRAHSSMVPISREQFNVIHYSGVLATKMAVSVLFFLPYIAIRLVIRKRKNLSPSH